MIENYKTMGEESDTKAASLREQMLTFNFTAHTKIYAQVFAILPPELNLVLMQLSLRTPTWEQSPSPC